MDNNSVLGAELPGQSPRGTPRPKPQLFTLEQRQVLLKYFDECGMTSTHRRNTELIQTCANEVGTTIERVKNWIGSEAVKRKKKAGILPRPKIELLGTASSPQTRLLSTPPAKKFKRVNGYNLFFSDTVRSGPEISTDFRERNATVARKWAELTEDKRKEWAAKAEAVCTLSMQEESEKVNGGGGLREGGGGGGEREMVQTLLGGASGVGPGGGLGGVVNPELGGETEETVIEKTLLSIQEKFDLLEQMGFEGYAVLVNTTELQSHFLATSKGRTFHKLRQTQSKPLENPFIGHVFTEEPEASGGSLMSSLSHTGTPVPMAPGGAGGGGGGGGSQQKRFSSTLSGLSSVETMQKSVLNAFALKYKVATGRQDIPYENLASLGVQVYGMPPGVPFHNPLLYNQQQLQQILANLEKIAFLKLSHDTSSQLSEVEISADSVAASLVSSHTHHLHLSPEEDPTQ